MAASAYKLIADEVRPHRVGTRTQSAALLAWFLQTVWRMEEEDVDEAICDGTGDKGIDGLAVDDDLAEITLFQTKYKTKTTGTQGDKDLKNLVGAERYFGSTKAIFDQLLRSNPNQELRDLIDRNEIRTKVSKGAHVNRLVFVTNGKLDPSGRDYLKAANLGSGSPLEVWDQKKLAPIARRTKRPELRPDNVKLVGIKAPIQTDLNGKAEMAVTIVPAKQLVRLKGIDDLTLFDRNVRLGLGKTRINNELEDTVRDKADTWSFPRINGLTGADARTRSWARCSDCAGIAVVNGLNRSCPLRQGFGDQGTERRRGVVRRHEQRPSPDHMTHLK